MTASWRVREQFARFRGKILLHLPVFKLRGEELARSQLRTRDREGTRKNSRQGFREYFISIVSVKTRILTRWRYSRTRRIGSKEGGIDR